MYLDFFNLRKSPFNITPDPDLLFLGPGNKEAMAAVIYGVTERKGFVAITGEVGVGKTTVIRSFLETKQARDLKVIYIFNANISFTALLRTIYRNLGIAPETDDLFEMVNQLHAVVIDLYKQRINVVLIIDEAQNMPVETLQNLHMLSNLETSTEKLIQIVFSGQPEFEQKLDQHRLRQLKQRIVIRARIRPFSSKESLAYIRHRLAKTTYGDPQLFSTKALRRIVRSAGGIPRVLNILCDNCLITAFGRGEKQVTGTVAGEIIAETAGSKRSRRSWMAMAACLLAAVALLALMNYLFLAPAETVSARTTPVQVPVQPPDEREHVPTADGSMRPSEQPVVGEASFTRIVKKGDTLAKLVEETYGSVNGGLIELVREHNPGIWDEDLIVEGDRISFPVKKP